MYDKVASKVRASYLAFPCFPKPPFLGRFGTIIPVAPDPESQPQDDRYSVPGLQEGSGKGWRVEQWGKMYLDWVQKQADGQGGLNCGQAASQVVPDRLPSRPTAVRVW